jgi:hypothetical protein
MRMHWSHVWSEAHEATILHPVHVSRDSMDLSAHPVFGPGSKIPPKKKHPTLNFTRKITKALCAAASPPHLSRHLFPSHPSRKCGEKSNTRRRRNPSTTTQCKRGSMEGAEHSAFRQRARRVRPNATPTPRRTRGWRARTQNTQRPVGCGWYSWQIARAVTERASPLNKPRGRGARRCVRAPGENKSRKQTNPRRNSAVPRVVVVIFESNPARQPPEPLLCSCRLLWL